MTRRPPRRAPCLARHHQVTMRASIQRVGPGQAWIATSRRGWVIAAWVLGCRARFTDSSLRTTCDSLLVPSPGKAPRSALHLDDSAYLAVLSTPIRTQWKGPPASRNLTLPGRSWSVPVIPTGCSGPRSNCIAGVAVDARHESPSRTALSTSRRPFEASSTDFGTPGARGLYLNTLPTWTRIGSAKPLSWWRPPIPSCWTRCCPLRQWLGSSRWS